MVFSSPVFLFLFLPLTLFFTLVFTPLRFRNHMLLLASLLFYAWGELEYTLIMLVSICFNYLFGLWIDTAKNTLQAKIALTVTLCVNLGLLIFFKYANFIVDNINNITKNFHFVPVHLDPVHLPIGISFFTFHSLSYCIDIYRKGVTAQRKPVNIALYIAFFPQLVAGPIIRYHDVAQQLIKRNLNIDQFATGIRRFIMGLAKKVLIANTMASVADTIFHYPANELTTATVWLGTLAYTLQIYFDFSGYSDMAIGLGKMFGFEFLENFNFPYISQSIKEFWRRWHISLSNWFRDYLYIPLGGNRLGTKRTYLNLLIVFFLTGLWHGASWTFIFWGLWHGFFLVIERLGFEKILDKIWKPFRHFYTLLVVMVAWVFFRADNFSYSISFVKTMFFMPLNPAAPEKAILFFTVEYVTVFIAGIIFAMPAYKLFILPTAKNFRTNFIPSLHVFGNIVLHFTLFFICCMSLASGTYNPFIYFRF